MMRELRMRNKFLYAGFVYVHTWHKFYARNISYLILCKKVCRNGGSAMKIEKSTKRIKNIFAFTVMICSLCLFCGFLVTEKASAKKTTVKKVSSTLKNGTFTVSGKGKMPESAMPKVAQKKKIKKIVIKNGVTELPEDAFRDCSKATVITIAPTVNRIGAMAFYNTGVEKISIPKKAGNLGYGMLQNCKNLKKLTIPGNFWAREPKKAANKKNLIGSLILGKEKCRDNNF